MESLLRTKLHIPQPNPRVVIRSHLLSRMDEGLAMGCKLTLVSAPVGYGKSTLVSSWLAGVGCPAAWLSLDEMDNDPVRFWTYVVAALQTAQPELGQATLKSLQGARNPSFENILSDLINQAAAQSGKLILVLDDYHLMDSPSLHQSLRFFLDHLPPQIHLVIITREDPPLPLPQLRAKGQMVELRASDLRFTQEESDQFLNHKMGLKLPLEGIATLERRTEGWVAGLQMAALSMYDIDDPRQFIEDFAGDNRFVADYLISEVLERQPEHIRDFLLRTSVVDRFTPALCDALIGDASLQSSRIIGQIEALGLFVISLDRVRQWYRYHQLFADLLRYRLRQDDPSVFMELNRTASRWYQQQGLVEEALKYALAGKDHDYAAELIEASGLTMIGHGRLTALQNWITPLPDRIVQEHPYLSVLLVWVGSVTGQRDLVGKHLALAEANLPMANADLRSEIICHIALLRAYASRSSGDLDSSLKHAQDALSQLPKNNIFLDCAIQLNLGGNYWLKGNFSALEEPLKHAGSFLDNPEVEYPALAATGFLANTRLQQGRLNQVETLCKNIVENKNHSAHPAAAYVFLEQGELLYERNDLEKALKVLSKTIQVGESADKIVNLVRARQLLARVYYLLGNWEEANTLVEQADELFNQSNPRYQVRYQIDHEYYRVRWLLLQQNLRPALQWSEDYKKRRNSIDNPWALLSELVYAHVLLINGKPDQALQILRASENSARSFEAGGWIIQSLVLQSLCYHAMNNPEKALELLSSALRLAEPEGYTRTFVDYGEIMQRLLNLALARDVETDYVTKLIEAFPLRQDEEEEAEPQRVLGGQYLVEPLTDQELSILRLMSAGLSHNEIADKLYLSINTVKWHTTHIYDKLGVHRRAHAVTRAKELGIL